MSLTGYLMTWKTDREEPLTSHPMLTQVIQAMSLQDLTTETTARMLQGREPMPAGDTQKEITAAAARVSRQWPRTTFTLRARTAEASESWSFYRNGKSYTATGNPPVYSQEEMEAKGRMAPEEPVPAEPTPAEPTPGEPDDNAAGATGATQSGPERSAE